MYDKAFTATEMFKNQPKF